jgi:hypothetical protein
MQISMQSGSGPLPLPLPLPSSGVWGWHSMGLYWWGVALTYIVSLFDILMPDE